MKIFIDTNIWISYFLSRSFGNLDSIFAKKDIEIFTCIEQMDELERVLRYPKLKNYFPEDVIADLLLFFSEKCTLVAIQRIVQECNDPEDNYILDIGIQHNLNYIITGDSDLLSMHPFHKLSILKIQNFLHLIE